jgi:HAD superfamily hydrolase (TIGR01549 family)
MDVCYFDLDGTLIEYETSFSAIYEETLDKLGVEPFGIETYSEAFFEALGNVNDPFAVGISKTGIDVDPTRLSETFVEVESNSVRPKPGANDVLTSLTGVYHLGILTNGVGRAQRAKLTSAGLTSPFESIIVSGEVDVRKPYSGIYRIGENRLHGESYSFVADDLERDVKPAINCGWNGIYRGGGISCKECQL